MRLLTDYIYVIEQLTLNANFSRKWEMPLGYATSYLEPESMTTKRQHITL